MEKTWLDTNITALHAINVGIKPTAQLNLETTNFNEIKDETIMLLLVGLGSRLEVYLPNSKVS